MLRDLPSHITGLHARACYGKFAVSCWGAAAGRSPALDERHACVGDGGGGMSGHELEVGPPDRGIAVSFREPLAFICDGSARESRQDRVTRSDEPDPPTRHFVNLKMRLPSEHARAIWPLDRSLSWFLTAAGGMRGLR
jgi:hypothetical protein